MTSMTRRTLMLAGAALAAFPGLTLASTYPERPIRIIVPFAPGGSLDILARFLAHAVKFGQPFIVENRSGAGGNIGFEATARSRPDGYTLMLASEPMTINPALAPTSYDPVGDFAPVSLIAGITQVLAVHPDVSVHNLDQLVQQARAEPNTINVSTAGPGSSGHLAVAMLEKSGVPMVHVPFRGGGPATAAVLGREVQAGIMALPSALAPIREGRLRPIAVTASERSLFLPDVPTLSEAMPDTAVDGWQALFAPASTPAPIVEQLRAAFVAVLDTDEAKAFLERQGFEKVGSTPAELGEVVRRDAQKWSVFVKEAGITTGG